ncbi:MAG: sigma-70 family RNA polymerase sigma factor [Phycisphaerae bacterium]|jgi:RNA polymerase sigma-70 factor (ECF subfamily)
MTGRVHAAGHAPVEVHPATLSLADRSDEELAVMAQRDHVGAFAELVTRFESRLFNFLLRRTGSAAAAEDISQDAFVRAWERIGRYDPTWRFSTWIFTIASRMAVTAHRRRRPAGPVEVADRVGRDDPDAGHAEHVAQRGARLWSLAERVLGDEQHTTLWLRYAEDMSIGEIAQVTGRTQVGVRVTLFRARQRLAQAAREAGLADDREATGEREKGERSA